MTSMTPTRLVYDLAGRPALAESMQKLMADVPAVCGVCGSHADRTAPTDRALGDNFTDRSMFRDERSSRVCPACVWCCSGKPPATLRLWTIVAAPGVDLGPSQPKAWLQDTPGLLLTNRANPAPVAAILADPPDGPWLVTVAVSGQKHVLPYGTVNSGPGQWAVRMEATTVTATPDQWRHVHGHAAALRRLGVPADCVAAGTPGGIRTAEQLATWRRHADQLTPWVGSPLLNLALWTITKGTLV